LLVIGDKILLFVVSCSVQDWSEMSSSSSIPSRLKSMLVDLGKPTLRGIRQCPKCKTVNGTRSSSCKNKQCDAVFKEHVADRRKKNVECVKVSRIWPFSTECHFS